MRISPFRGRTLVGGSAGRRGRGGRPWGGTLGELRDFGVGRQ